MLKYSKNNNNLVLLTFDFSRGKVKLLVIRVIGRLFDIFELSYIIKDFSLIT